ncbi:MAG: hypothetical protein HOP29_06675 [Phycisphaerales bacterium]|nr:hypothetical protein [Phycisphaerales bacterium]
MTRKATSRNGVAIRLTDERWVHIVDEHCELGGFLDDIMRTVEEADRVLAGGQGELIAVRKLETGHALAVVYREVPPDDGFVITAFRTSRWDTLNRRRQLWPPTK